MTTSAKTTVGYARFFQLLRKAQNAGVLREDDHHQVISELTGGLKSSLRELTREELRRAEQQLQELVDPVGAAANRMRRKVIAILAAHGATDAEGRPDMVRINAWAQKYGHGKKPLNHYTNAELPTLVTQAERVMASDIKAITNG